METQRRSIFVIGDSISIHYGPYLKELLQDKFNYDRKRGIDEALEDLDKPLGANAGDSSMVLKYLNEEKLKGTRYDILLLNCGMHDIRVHRVTRELQIKPEQYKSNLDEIIRLAKHMSVEVIWITSTPIIERVHNAREAGFLRFSRDLKRYNHIAEEIMDKHNIETVDLYSYTQRLGENIYCDHVHFTEEVRKLQAVFIARYLNNIK